MDTDFIAKVLVFAAVGWAIGQATFEIRMYFRRRRYNREYRRK